MSGDELASGRRIYFLAGRTGTGCALLWLRSGDGSAPRFRKNPTKNQKTTRTRGKDTRREKNMGREKGGREEDRERERRWWDEEGGKEREILAVESLA